MNMQDLLAAARKKMLIGTPKLSRKERRRRAALRRAMRRDLDRLRAILLGERRAQPR